jgi:adenylate kinase family enzyme
VRSGSTQSDIKQSLAHVLWMGGSPCSGKSSIAETLANRYGLTLYRCDDAFWEHMEHADPDRHPTLHKLNQTAWNEIWMRPVDVQIAEEMKCYYEEFDMLLDDLLEYPRSTPVLAEGAALLPDLVSGLLPDDRRAIWIVPTAAFQRAHYTPEQRPWVKDILKQCQDATQAFQNWMDRDAGFANQVSTRVRELGFRLIEVDGERTIEENTEMVADHFRLVEGGSQ